jgi:hypothetical protein
MNKIANETRCIEDHKAQSMAQTAVNQLVQESTHELDMLVAGKRNAIPMLVDIKQHWYQKVQSYIEEKPESFPTLERRRRFRQECWKRLCVRMMNAVKEDFTEDPKPSDEVTE